MSWRNIWRSALIITLSIALVIVLIIAGLIGFTFFAYSLGGDHSFSTNEIDAALVQTVTDAVIENSDSVAES